MKGARTIIVGAGSAGCVLAHRLSAAGDDVLLLEAGPDYTDDALPEDLANGKRNSMVAHDWGFEHRPHPGSVPLPLPRGRVVGGSSAVNTCIALRGMPYDFDEWAARGLEGWGYRDCLPYFKRLERDVDFDGPLHGQDGPLTIQRWARDEWHPWSEAFVQAAEDAGFDFCADHNDPAQTGVGPMPKNEVRGRRISAASAYLTPEVRARPNLRIAHGVQVRRVRFEGSRATGVDAIIDGVVERIPAERVLLAGGAVLTPKLLLASGIGPAHELSRLAVPRRVDLPGVGATILDHPGFAFFLVPERPMPTSVLPALQVVLRLRSSVGGRENDIQIQPGNYLPFAHRDVEAVSIMCSVGKPRGAGTIRFRSLAPRVKPEVEAHFLRDPDDLDTADEAAQIMGELGTHPAMRAIARFSLPLERGLASRRTRRKTILRQCASGFHPSGTAKMGGPDDPLAVCDGRGRVRDTDGLYVVDASLLPTMTSANIHLPVLMIAEKLADTLAKE